MRAPLGLRGARPRARAGRGDGARARRPRPAPGGHARRSWSRTRSSPAPRRATASATWPSAARRPCRPPSSRASTTSRSATCTARSAIGRPRALRRLAGGLLVLGGAASASRLAAGRPRPDGGDVELVDAPVPRPLAVLRGTLDDAAGRPGARRPRGAWVQATLTDPRARRRDGAAAAALPAHASRWPSSPRRGAPRPRARYAERLRGLDDQELLASFVRRRARRRGRARTSCALLRDALTAGARRRGLGADAPAPARAVRVRRLRRHRDGRLRRARPRPGCSCSTAAPARARRALLDAVCFAFYGDGPRRAPASAARLRSDHAPPETATEVVLEATPARAADPDHRAPPQERPKKRGDGTTTEQHRGHAWSRSSERRVGAVLATPPRRGRRLELGDLLGMSREQFCQVVLLPQGELRTLPARAQRRARAPARRAVRRRPLRRRRALAARPPPRGRARPGRRDPRRARRDRAGRAGGGRGRPRGADAPPSWRRAGSTSSSSSPRPPPRPPARPPARRVTPAWPLRRR